MSGYSSRASLKPFIQKLDTASKQVAPADRAEFVRLVVLLFTAVRTCQQAYLRHRERNAEENYASRSTSIKTLGSAIESLEATLHIFAPNVFAGVREDYAGEAEVVPYVFNEALEFLDRLNYSLDYPRLRYIYADRYIDLDRPPKEEDFDLLIDQLGKFIRKNFSMEEVFRASST